MTLSSSTTSLPDTIEYVIHTKKYGDITMLIDKSSLPIIEALPSNSRGNKLVISYYKNNKSLYPTVTNHPNSPFTGCFYVFTNNKVAIHRLIANCPRNLVVDHINHNTLDNRLCNLKVCTQADNRKNNQKAYTDTRKLTATQIEQILINPDNLTYNQLAKLYSVSNCLISAIRAGKIYTDIAPSVPRVQHRTLEHIPLKVKKWVKLGLANGVSISEISKELGIPKNRLYQVRRGKIWKDV